MAGNSAIKNPSMISNLISYKPIYIIFGFYQHFWGISLDFAWISGGFSLGIDSGSFYEENSFPTEVPS
jgi:hypothetical protein